MNQTPQSLRTYTGVTNIRYHQSLSLGTHTGFSVADCAGAHSSQKGPAPWRGQCHWACVGVPSLRPPGLTRWARPLPKQVMRCLRQPRHFSSLFEALKICMHGFGKEGYRVFPFIVNIFENTITPSFRCGIIWIFGMLLVNVLSMTVIL